MFKTEVCCGGLADVINACKGGAYRAELCSDLFFGGLTPSLGTFLMAKEQCDLQIAVMLRPREGGFCYSKSEFEVMMRDGEIFIENGANAIVFGCLNADGTLNTVQTKALCQMAEGRCQTVFHKAFDVCQTPVERRIDTLKAMGVTRILTSGGKKTALEGAEVIGKLIAMGGKDIEIMPGGGVRAENIQQLIAMSGCTMAHTSGFESRYDLTCGGGDILFTGENAPKQGEYKQINSQIIAKFVETVK